MSVLTPSRVGGVPGEILAASPPRMDDIPPTEAVVSLVAVKSTIGWPVAGDALAEEEICWKMVAFLRRGLPT